MLLFIVIFFAMVIVLGVAAVAGFSFYLKRRTKQLQTENPKKFIDEPPFRSLFEPTDEELRALERAASKEAAAKAADEARLLTAKKNQAVRDFQVIWANEPNKMNTVGLFQLAAVTENAEIFSETAETVIEFWRENKIANLTANDLADLLDSHLGTLPQQERTAGAVFWLRQEIMSLRSASE